MDGRTDARRTTTKARWPMASGAKNAFRNIVGKGEKGVGGFVVFVCRTPNSELVQGIDASNARTKFEQHLIKQEGHWPSAHLRLVFCVQNTCRMGFD